MARAEMDAGTGYGERRERAMRRRRLAIIGVLLVAGLATGFYVGANEAKTLFHGGRFWSPTVSIALTAIYVTAILGGSLLLSGSMDELERQRSYKAASFAAAAYILVYPVWFLLWKGGLVAQPAHAALFIIFWLSLALSTLYYRFR